MDIANIVAMFGAIATFLFGMSTMTDGLEKLSSGRLEHILERLTSNVFKGVLLGAVVTGLIQSSAATTVMCVGFVNAGIMKLEQTVASSWAPTSALPSPRSCCAWVISTRTTS